MADNLSLLMNLFVSAVSASSFGSVGQQYSSTAHKMLHIAIILIGTLLLGISIIAYVRTRRRKLLILNGALALFALKEYIIFSSVVFYWESDIIIPYVGAPITHVLNFGILMLIFLGILG